MNYLNFFSLPLSKNRNQNSLFSRITSLFVCKSLSLFIKEGYSGILQTA